MKKSVKQSLILCAVSAMLFVSAASVSAAPTVRPMPGSQSNTVTSSGTSASNETGVSSQSGNYRASDDNDSNSDNSDNGSNSESSTSNGGSDNTGVVRTAPTAIPTTDDGKVNIVTDTEQSQGNKGSVSVGTMIIWLIISVLINAGISFWIGNRFYRLSKKDTHLTSEVRALRRDVEEKFLMSVGGFAEQETDISNANEDYSRDGEGITMQRRQRQEEVSPAEEDELLRKWEGRMNARQSAARPTAETRYEPNVRRKYQPTRDEEPIEEDEYEEEPKSGIKSKAKGILNDIFPFKED